MVIVVLDLIEAEKLEVLFIRLYCLAALALPVPHTFGVSGACLLSGAQHLPAAFFIILPLKFSLGDPCSLNLLTALRSVGLQSEHFWGFM